MNIDPLCCKQVPLLLMWLVEMLRGWGKPEWYQVPCQVAGNWHCCCACCGTVVKPTLINAKDRVHKKLWPAGLNRPPLFKGTFSRFFFIKRSVNFRMNLWSHRFSQNMNQNMNQGFLPCSIAQYWAEILTIFASYFGRNDDFILKFTDL